MFYILGGNKVAIGGATAGPTAANKAPTKMTAKPATGAPVHSASTVSTVSKGPAASSVKPGVSKTTKDSGDVAKLQQEI